MSQGAISPFLARAAFSDSARIRTWNKIEAQVRYNIDLVKSLELLRDRAKARRSGLYHTFSLILERMYAGQSFGASLTGLAPAEEILLIMGGESSGDFARTLPLCVELVEAKRRIVGALVQALSYPALLAAMMLGLFIVVSIHVMPQLSLLTDPSKLTGSAAVMFALSEFTTSPAGIAIGALLALAVFLSLVTLPYWTGPARLWVESLPPWSFYRLVVGSVWLFTVAILMRSNMQLNTILATQLASPNLSPWLRERVRAIHTEVGLGKSLGAALADCGLGFPDAELVEDLCMYAKLPRFHQQLYSMAKQWLQDGVKAISRQAQLLNVGCLLAIIGLLCGVALAIGSLQQQLSTHGGF